MGAARRAKKAVPVRKRPAKPARADAELIKMSELSKRSGTSAPTIKHYIREGLLPGPELRTSRNMAYYDGRLAARIVVIKELQAQRFLPLRVIGELLEPAPSDKLRPERDAAQRRGMSARPGVQRRKRSDVMKTFGVSRAELDSLEKAGVVELRGEGETAGYSGIDLELLDILADVRRRGLGDLFPISVAEPYMAAVQKLVEFESDVFRAALSRDLALPLDEVAAASVQIGQRLVIALRAKLLLAAQAR
jgi:DNA-binding transcriptional MerR regulator